MLGTVFALAIYAAILLWAGWLNRRQTESLDFHLSGRRVGFLRIGMSTFSLVGGGEFVTLTALAYAFGFMSSTFFAGVVAGFLVFGVLAHRARERVETADIHSSPDYFYAEFGRMASSVATVLAALSIASLFVLQLMVGGQLLAGATGLTAWVCILGMATVVCVYVYLGGFNGILTTDLIQGTCLAVAMLTLVVAYALAPETKAATPYAHDPIPLSDALTLIVTGFFAVVGGADVWQRVCSAKDDKTAAKGLYFGGVSWLFLGGLIVFLALMIAARHPDADPNTAFVEMLMADLPAWLASFVSLLLFSALLSTADTELFLLAVLVGKEFNRGKPGVELSILTTKRLTICITVAGVIAALFLEGLVNVYFTLLYCMMILGPITLARMLGRAPAVLAFIGLVLGGGTLLVLAITGQLLGWYPLLILVGPALAFVAKGQARAIITGGGHSQ